MNQQIKRAFIGALCLILCACVFASCIHLTEQDFSDLATDRTDGAPNDTTPPTESTEDKTVPGTESLPPIGEEDTTTAELETTETTTPEAETSTPSSDTETSTPAPETTVPEPPPVVPKEPIKIYIDQGHNPFSPTHPPSWNTGASNEALGLYEQDLTYEIGILLAELLSKDDRFEVRLSRPTPETILGVYNGSVSEANDSALDARVNDAEAWGADYFISLHINAAEATTARGIEVYTATGDDVGYALGEDILDQLVKSTSMRNRGMKNGSHLRVLKKATMPAALLEMGFISNAEDAKLLDESPELFAQGIYNGMITYFASLQDATA